MKKIISILLVALTLFVCLTACVAEQSEQQLCHSLLALKPQYLEPQPLLALDLGVLFRLFHRKAYNRREKSARQSRRGKYYR